MTDIPDTYSDLVDLWAGTVGPTEPSPRLPRTIRIVGSVWTAHEQPDGRWVFCANGQRIWGPMTGDLEDVYTLLVQVHRDPSPRAETQGHPVPDSDPLAPARGILAATAIMALVYAGVFAVLRWRGVL